MKNPVKSLLWALAVGLIVAIINATTQYSTFERINSVWTVIIWGTIGLLIALLILGIQYIVQKSIKGEFKWKTFLAFLGSLIFAALVIWGVFQILYINKDVKIPLKETLDEAIIKVPYIMNREVEIRKETALFGIGVGTGVGVGNTRVSTYTWEQFRAQVPEGERIFACLELSDMKTNGQFYALKKLYLAFIENRAGEIAYTEPYSYQEGDSRFWIKDANWQRIIFHYNNKEKMIFFVFVLCIIAIVCVGCITKYIYDHYE